MAFVTSINFRESEYFVVITIQPETPCQNQSTTLPSPPAGPCKHCGGTGKIVLLTSSRTCGFCCGSGKIGELTEYRHRADTDPKELAGQLAMTTQTACVVTETYYYEDERKSSSPSRPTGRKKTAPGG
jgi:hypothetical protein